MDKRFCPYCMTPVQPGESCPVCGLTAGSYVPSPHHLPPGTVLLDRYLVGRVLGEGGFGITYIGCDLRLELKIAIKEYYPVDRATRNASASLNVTSFIGLSSQSFERGKQKFLDEARTMARMDKQQVIVSVRDFFEANNTAYIVMEYIEGTTFSDLVEQKGGRIPPEELFQTLEPLFRALSIMHETRLIHRDISPDNLMLENGRVRLLDFGCARETSRGTETLTIALKHGYAPLEQYQQKGQGPWTDIYALCATIYFCLTGKAPPQALDRIAEDGLLLPSKLGVPIAPHQEAALLKGLMIRPNRRYQTVEELRAALYAPAPDGGFVPAPDPKPLSQPAQAKPEEPPVPETQPVEPEPAAGPEAAEPDPAVADGEERPQRTAVRLPGKTLAAIAGAAVLLVIALAVFLSQGSGPAVEGPDTAESGVFAEAVRLPETADEDTLRVMLENGSVPAVVLSADSHVTVSDGALEITKPLLVEEGARLDLWQTVTVSGEGLLQIGGEVYVEGFLRTAGGGSMAVEPAGRLTGRTAVWLEHEEDLTVASGGVAEMEGRTYGETGSGDRFIVLCEEELFADAVHVASFAEYQAALHDSRTAAIVIDGDMELTPDDAQVNTVPALISEGVTVSGPSGWDQWDWLVGGVLINRGTLTAGLNAGDWDGSGNGICTIVNYGELNGCLFLDCPGSLINLGELTVDAAQVLQTDVYNLGTLTHSGEKEEEAFLNFYCGTVYNGGQLVETGHNNGYVTLNRGVCLGNYGDIRVEEGGSLENYALLDTCGELTVDAGGWLNNMGWLIALDGSLHLDPESKLSHTGLIQWCSEEPLEFPNHVEDGGGSVMVYQQSGDARLAATEAELREALADDNCGLVELSGDVAVSGGLTIAKGLHLDGSTLTLLDGGLTISGADAFLCGGTLQMGGGSLTLTDGAVMTGIQTEDCGGLAIRERAKLLTWDHMELNTGAPVELDSGGHLINLGGMTLEEADITIGENSVFRSCADLETKSAALYIAAHGELLCNNADVSLYNTGLTIEERGILSASGNHDGYTFKLWGPATNYGWMEFGIRFQYGISSMTNYGTLQFSHDLELQGALDNKGTMLAVEGAAVQMEGHDASFIGSQPEQRDEWTLRP